MKTEKDLAVLLAQIAETHYPAKVEKSGIREMIANELVCDMNWSGASYAVNHICEPLMVARESGEIVGAVYYLEFCRSLYATTDREIIEYVGKIPETPRKLFGFTIRHLAGIISWREYKTIISKTN